MMYPFIEKLLRMLDDPETQHIASWSDDGKSIIIHDLRNFEAQVLSKHFPYGRSDSFCRQLNIYNFKRTSDARKQRQNPKSRVSTFEHPHFQRGRLDLIGLIRRNKPIRASRSKHQNHSHNNKDRSPSSTYPISRQNSDYSVRLPSIHNLPNWNSYQSSSHSITNNWQSTNSRHHSNISGDNLIDYLRINHERSHHNNVIRHQKYHSQLPHDDDEDYSSDNNMTSSRISRDPHPSSATSYSDSPSHITPVDSSRSSPPSSTSSTTHPPPSKDISSIFSIENLIN